MLYFKLSISHMTDPDRLRIAEGVVVATFWVSVPAPSNEKRWIANSFSYFLLRYTRSPPALFADSICRWCCLAAVDRKPRTLCASQPLVSSSVLPRTATQRWEGPAQTMSDSLRF